MTEKEITMEDLDESAKQTDEQLDMLEWKIDNVEKELVAPVNAQDLCVMNLLKSVSELVAYLLMEGAVGLHAAAARAGGGAGAAARAVVAAAVAAAAGARQVRALTPEAGGSLAAALRAAALHPPLGHAGLREGEPGLHV